jgi:hypothetical protein
MFRSTGRKVAKSINFSFGFDPKRGAAHVPSLPA